MEFLIFLAVALVIITPILAISAFVRVQRLSEQLRTFPLDKVSDRLSTLERQLAAMEKTLSSGQPPAAAPPKPVVSPAAPVSTPPQSPPPPPAPTALGSRGSLPETPKPHEFAAHPPQPSIFAAPPLYASQSKSTSSLDWETVIGGRWLNRIGIVALIGATTFFLKYAFDNDWIGPRGRVAIGIVLGAAMLPWSQWLLSRGYSYFSEGIAGLGAAVMYLSFWAGCQYYTLYTRDVGFYAMILVTAGTAAVALGRNSQRIALLSLVGGFLTPLLVSSGKDEQVVLFSYLLMLGLGLLVIELRRNWRALTPVSFVFSIIYFWGWYEKFYQPAKLGRTLIFATLFLLLYAVLPILRAVKSSSVNEIDFLLVLANPFAYFAALYVMLWPKDRWPLTLLALALSAGHVTVARVIPPPKSGESPLMRFLYAGVALTFATLAIPLRLDGKWITLAFAVEGAVLVWTGFRSALAGLRGAGEELSGPWLRACSSICGGWSRARASLCDRSSCSTKDLRPTWFSSPVLLRYFIPLGKDFPPSPRRNTVCSPFFLWQPTSSPCSPFLSSCGIISADRPAWESTPAWPSILLFLYSGRPTLPL